VLLYFVVLCDILLCCVVLCCILLVLCIQQSVCPSKFNQRIDIRKVKSMYYKANFICCFFVSSTWFQLWCCKSYNIPKDPHHSITFVKIKVANFNCPQTSRQLQFVAPSRIYIFSCYSFCFCLPVVVFFLVWTSIFLLAFPLLLHVQQTTQNADN